MIFIDDVCNLRHCGLKGGISYGSEKDRACQKNAREESPGKEARREENCD